MIMVIITIIGPAASLMGGLAGSITFIIIIIIIMMIIISSSSSSLSLTGGVIFGFGFHRLLVAYKLWLQ